jgi:hypothetical protein
VSHRKKGKIPKLSKVSKTAVDRFDAAARSWGWESDQGVHNVETSLKEYEEAKKLLEKRIVYLETQLRKARDLVASLM